MSSTDGYVELRLSPAEAKALMLSLAYGARLPAVKDVLKRLVEAYRAAKAPAA